MKNYQLSNSRVPSLGAHSLTRREASPLGSYAALTLKGTPSDKDTAPHNAESHRLLRKPYPKVYPLGQ